MAKKYTHIEVRGSSIHHRGVFALEKIKAGTRIVQYTGRRLTKAQAAKSRSDYLFELNKKYDIDGKNIARYINHTCEPNCETDVIAGKIWIIALRDIEPEEELSYNYRYSLEEGLQYPCNCGARKCVGYILAEEEWGKARSNRKSRKRDLVPA